MSSRERSLMTLVGVPSNRSPVPSKHNTSVRERSASDIIEVKDGSLVLD